MARLGDSSFDKIFAAMLLDSKGDLTMEKLAQLKVTAERCRNCPMDLPVRRQKKSKKWVDGERVRD